MVHETEIDLKQVETFLKDALNKVMTQENPDLLNDVKKIYKKAIPFSKRLYVAAYLAKEASQDTRGKGRFYNGRRDEFPRGGRYGSSYSSSYGQGRGSYMRDTPSPYSRDTPQKERRGFAESHGEEHSPRPHVEIDESLASTIFISIGRNRRVYPRDLVGLLINVAHLERDRIGEIRVLANYSFVQLYKEDTEKVIAALDGYDYRGRKLAVSYSRHEDMERDEAAQDSEDAKAYAAAEKAASDKEPFSSPVHSGTESDATNATPAQDAAASNSGEYLV